MTRKTGNYLTRKKSRRPRFTGIGVSTAAPHGVLSDDQLARLTKEERVEAGLDDYDPDEVPRAEE